MKAKVLIRAHRAQFELVLYHQLALPPHQDALTSGIALAVYPDWNTSLLQLSIASLLISFFSLLRCHFFNEAPPPIMFYKILVATVTFRRGPYLDFSAESLSQVKQYI